MDMDLSAMVDNAREASSFLKSLANEKRLLILCTLSDKEMSVSELNEHVEISQSALSQHLAWLREAELVATRREAQTIFYRLEGQKALKVIGVLKEIFCP
ncbi:MAG: metalloregulator ArsR/SmtB family transcription factor [Cellvibrionaceae bacterium]|nr:metalloregulator ArsR/SmtB family transcription factor [Cellvibrionaceae bacterium]MCV6626799.1 metalloregulator ArsR/SmtB family transcription factor [Cellvibrionaceae bacterium]